MSGFRVFLVSVVVAGLESSLWPRFVPMSVGFSEAWILCFGYAVCPMSVLFRGLDSSVWTLACVSSISVGFQRSGFRIVDTSFQMSVMFIGESERWGSPGLRTVLVPRGTSLSHVHARPPNWPRILPKDRGMTTVCVVGAKPPLLTHSQIALSVFWEDAWPVWGLA